MKLFLFAIRSISTFRKRLGPITQAQAQVRCHVPGLTEIGLRGRSVMLVLLLMMFAGCRPATDVAEQVELLCDLENLKAAATFELRFDQPMVTASQLGTPATKSPLVITPSIPGSFVWLSQRSGTFTPTQSLSMDTRYTLTLASRLCNAAGQPAQARLHKTLRTPPFSVVGFLPTQGSTNASAEPEVKLVFNATVQAGSAYHYIEFRNAAGRRVAAEVRQATLAERPAPYELNTGESLRPWSESFTDRQSKPTSSGFKPAGILLSATNLAPNVLIASPCTSLPIGMGWQLVVDAGLPAAEGGLRLPGRQTVAIGNVTPLTFLGATSRNVINQLPSITLEFSKPLAAVLARGWPEWIGIEPCPTNLAVDLCATSVILRGSFQSETTYSLTLRAGLPAAEPFTLAITQAFKADVPRVAPRLYFSAFSGEQLAFGNRTFPLLAVNVPKVRLRAKLLEPQTALYALDGYSSYFRRWRERNPWNEPFRRVDYNLVPGRTVFSEEVPGSLQADAATNLVFSWDRITAGRKTAVVFLEAERVSENRGDEERLGTQALVQLTDLGVIWKRAPSQIEAFVFSHSSGQPVSGAAVRVLSGENELLGQATTSAEGLARMSAHTNAQWLAVQSGDDFHALAIQECSTPGNSFHLPTTDPSVAEEVRRVLLFADRELYRVGETLQLKAVVRDWTDRGLTVPAGLTGTLVCSDARERKFFETNVDLSLLGSCATAVPLISEARGQYRAVLRLDKREYLCFFQVEDFQPSAFDIALPAQPAYGPDEPIALPLSAHYYFGKPLSQAQVKWFLEAEDTDFEPGAFPGFTFSRSQFESRFSRGPSRLTRNGQGKLTGATNLVIAPELPFNAAAPQPRTASLRVEVTDINQQTLSGQVQFIQHSSEFYLGLKQAGEVHSAGKELALEIVAAGRDGKPWPEPVKAQVTLQRIEWRPMRLQGAGRSVRYRNEAVFTNVAERAIQVLPPRWPPREGEVTPGTPIVGLIPLQAGQYLIEASATDPGGHQVASSIEFTVAAREHLAWDYRNDTQLTLKPDQSVYAPGETAQILVEAPISGVALVTVERDHILRSFTTTLAGNAPMIRVPIEPGDVPNLFISVTLVRGSEACPRQVKEPEYRVGYCQLAVRDPQHHLAVKVSSAAPHYLPAQPVALTVDVKDSRGGAVSNAEVTLYAVDEGVLSLSGTEVPEPYAFFYAPRPLAVQSGISLPNLLEEDPTELHFANKGYLGGGGGSEGLRKNFLACAFWQAALRTDSNGQVQAVFPAPDSLTSYRVVAVACTRENQFGSAQSAFQVTKPLVVEPALPRFANVTDRVQARAVLYNQTSRTGEVEVTLQLDNHAKSTESSPTLTRRVYLAAHGSAAVEFPVEFVAAGEARWIWSSRFLDEPQGGVADAVQSVLPVGYPAPVLREILLAKAKQAEVDLLSGANPQLAAGNGTVTVELANSRLINLSEAISRLLHYPYGCAEQTASSLLPWIVLQDQSQWRPLLFRGTNDASRTIRAGIARLFSMQTQSGGLGYWPKDREPMFWASAYGGMVLALAQRHGVDLPKEDFGRLLHYLSAQFRSNSSAVSSADDLCLAAYALALAGQAEPAYHEKLFSQRAQLSLEGRALLALTIAESQGSREMASTLLLATATAGSQEKEMPFGCSARQKAIRLLAEVCARPDEAGIDELVTDLMNEQEAGQWSTTQGNAWATLALAEYGRRMEGNLDLCEGELRWGENTIPFRLEGTNNVFIRTLPLDSDSTRPKLTLVRTKGIVFASTTIAARPQVARQPRQDQGFGLQRRYQRLNDENQVEEARNLRVGDRVLITLRLDVRQPARFVAVDDALPANLEAIHPEFKTQQTRGGVPSNASEFDAGECWRSDFQELRAERALFFANEVAPGNYLIRYLARVRAAATASAPAAKVEEMYHPNRYGLTETQVFSSLPME